MLSLIKFKKNNPAEVLSWSGYDFANSAFATTILAVIFNHYFAETVAGGPYGIPFKLLGMTVKIPGASVFQFAVALSMIAVIFAAPILGAVSDHSKNKKSFLIFFCFLGSIFTGLLFFIRQGDIVSGALFFITANFAFAAGNVFYNSLLIDIAHPDDMGKISGLGWGLGYLGGGLCLVLNLIMLKNPELLGFTPGQLKIYHTFPTVALWWIIFSIPLFIWVKERKNIISPVKINFLRAGFQRLARTYHNIRRYRQLLRFLIAYIFFNEGIETTIITASIFGAEIIGLNSVQLIGFFLIVQATAFIGSIFFGYLVDAIGNKKALLISIAVWSIIILWARFIGLFGAPVKEFYILGMLTGLVLGGSQSAARSLQASFSPPDCSGEFFGFFAVCGKFAAMLGPLIYGTVVIFTGNLRSGILVLLVLFLIGGFILYFVDEKEGIQAAA